jgi:hypothetical protein
LIVETDYTDTLMNKWTTQWRGEDKKWITLVNQEGVLTVREGEKGWEVRVQEDKGEDAQIWRLIQVGEE